MIMPLRSHLLFYEYGTRELVQGKRIDWVYVNELVLQGKTVYEIVSTVPCKYPHVIFMMCIIIIINCMHNNTYAYICVYIYIYTCNYVYTCMYHRCYVKIYLPDSDIFCVFLANIHTILSKALHECVTYIL